MRRSRPLTAQAHGRQPRLCVGIQRPSELLRAIVVYVRATTKLALRGFIESPSGVLSARQPTAGTGAARLWKPLLYPLSYGGPGSERSAGIASTGSASKSRPGLSSSTATPSEDTGIIPVFTKTPRSTASKSRPGLSSSTATPSEDTGIIPVFTKTPRSTASKSQVQGAVYGAVNAIERHQRPYLVTRRFPMASMDAAAATAAFRVLDALFPAQH